MKQRKHTNKIQHNQEKPVDLNPHFHEEVTYNSFRENWSGLFSLLLIPVFILLVGVGVYTTFQLPKPDNTNVNDKVNNIQIGVGGGPAMTLSPTPTMGVVEKGQQLDYVQ